MVSFFGGGSGKGYQHVGAADNESGSVIYTVPDLRKAEAVRKTVKEKISPDFPASILRNHDAAWLYL